MRLFEPPSYHFIEMNIDLSSHFQRQKTDMRENILYLLFFIFILLPIYSHASTYEIEIRKSAKELLIKDDEKVIKKYRISLGRGGKGPKRELGDKKTPIGVYHIVDFNNDSRFHLFMQLDYPNLLDAWYGYKNQTIDASEFKMIATAFKNKKTPPQNTRLGGLIGIHGIGDMTDEKMMIHEGIDWTEGCIALTNDEIEELRQYVGIGTRVVIKQ